MAEDDSELSIDELAERVGVPVRTVRFYIARGLLPGPGSRGKGATYGEEHLLRLRLIRLLSESRVPLDDIGKRLGGLGADEVRALLAEGERQGQAVREAEAGASPTEYVSALLRRAQAARQPPALAPPPPMAEPGERLYAPPVRRGDREGEEWRRWTLAPGVELHVRSDATGRWPDLVGRLRAVADSLIRRNREE